MALTVNHCCCGCSLRTGTSIIAVYMLTCSILLMIFTSVAMYSVSTELKNRNDTYFYIDMFDVMNDRELKVALISGIIGGAVQSLLNVMLLIGVNKEKRGLVLVWLVSYVVFLSLVLLSFVISFFQFRTNPFFQVGAVINIGLHLYFLLVVRSYLYTLPDDHHGQQNAVIGYENEKTSIKRVRLE